MSQFLLAEVCLQPFYCNFIINSSNEKPCICKKYSHFLDQKNLPPVANYFILLGKQYILRQKLHDQGCISIRQFMLFIKQQYEEDK